jgi:hypothetical protein
MNSKRSKEMRRKGRQYYKRAIEEEWRKVFAMPLKVRVRLAWRILIGK